MTKIVDVPNVGKLAVEKVIDCTGMGESTPQFETKRAILKMQTGQIGEIILTDPFSVENVTTLLAISDTEYLGVVEINKGWNIYFRKGKRI